MNIRNIRKSRNFHQSFHRMPTVRWSDVHHQERYVLLFVHEHPETPKFPPKFLQNADRSVVGRRPPRKIQDTIRSVTTRTGQLADGFSVPYLRYRELHWKLGGTDPGVRSPVSGRRVSGLPILAFWDRVWFVIPDFTFRLPMQQQ